MKIPFNDKAVKQLGGNGVITKEIFDKAEIITHPDIIAISTMGFLPKLIPLIGDARIFGNYTKCSEVSSAIFDSFKIANSDEAAKKFDINKYATSDNINDMNKQHEDKNENMFKFLINKFFWNFIWVRMWSGVFDLLEKLIAKPIDTPIIILSQLFKFKIKLIYKK